MPSPEQWRDAANGLREHAAKWEALASAQTASEVEVWAALAEWKIADTGSILDRENARTRLRLAIDAHWQPWVPPAGERAEEAGK